MTKEESVKSVQEAPRRSDATRAAILDAARDRFAADGYERATIRLIAREAGIDPSMVMRYYGNKAGLFAAACEFDLNMPDVYYVPDADIATTLVRHYVERWENDEALKALLRVGATNAGGAERMRGIFRAQLVPAAEKLHPDPAEAGKRAGLVAAQMLGMAFTRYVLELPPVVDLTHEEMVEWLAPTVHRYLTAEGPRSSVEPPVEPPG